MVNKNYVPASGKRLCFRALAALLTQHDAELVERDLFCAFKDNGTTAGSIAIRAEFQIVDNRIHLTVLDAKGEELSRAVYRVEAVSGSIRRVIR